MELGPIERGIRGEGLATEAGVTRSSASRAIAIAIASLLGCSIGSGNNETFGGAASVGGNTQGASGSGDVDGSAGEEDPDGTVGGGQEGATSADPPGETDDPPDPGSEVCNGVDDDGDGMIDEDQPSVSCGVGSCAVTEASCVGGVPQDCTPALPGGEICNSLDDDCNGAVDDIQQACSTPCGEGTVVCNGAQESCDGPPPQAESCNLVDDDCNGSFDDVGGCRIGVHRSVHPVTGEHFYTTSLDEAQCCGFMLENADFYRLYSGPQAGLVPFYRCYTPGGFHFYTQDANCEGLTLEGAMGYIASAEGTAGSVPLFRLYLGTNGDHFFTTSAAERDNAVAVFGYVYEGVAGFVW